MHNFQIKEPMIIGLTFMMLLAMITACNEKKIDLKAEGDKVMETSREWSKSAATDSIEKTLSYWADDAIFMSPGKPVLNGKTAIREMIEGTSKIPGFKISWEPLSVSVSKSGDMAYMIEQSQITMNDSSGKPITEYTKGVTIWRKEADGSWKNVLEMGGAEPSKNK